MDRVLDLLHHAKWNLDGSLTFRRSCAHGVCESDAMVINGANRLARKVLVRELGEQITVEPLRGLPVKRTCWSRWTRSSSPPPRCCRS
jgi:succinate dehydrogenase / fumarate reductase iron-sulfur subunit